MIGSDNARYRTQPAQLRLHDARMAVTRQPLSTPARTDDHHGHEIDAQADAKC